jgi:uncharacterized protein (DUF4415 family)
MDLPRLRAMTEEEIMRTSPPELANLPADFWDHAEWVEAPARTLISMRIDRDVLNWFRSFGPGYQTWMQGVLRNYMMKMRSTEPAARRPQRVSEPPAVVKPKAKQKAKAKSKKSVVRRTSA